VAGVPKKSAKKDGTKGPKRKGSAGKEDAPVSVLTHTQRRVPSSVSTSSSSASTKKGSKKTRASSLKQSVASSGYGISSSYGAGMAKPTRIIDTALLQEAFGYADQVAEEQKMEERRQQREMQLQQQQLLQQQEYAEYGAARGETGYYFESEEPGQQLRQMTMEMQQQNPEVSDGTRWAPEPVKRRVGGTGTSAGAGPTSVYRGQKGLPSNKVNVVRSLKSNKGKKSYGAAAGQRSGDAFAVSAQSMDNSLNSKSNPTDFDALLRNFTEGINIQKLRSELAQSQASMQRSKQYILDMAHGN